MPTPQGSVGTGAGVSKTLTSGSSLLSPVAPPIRALSKNTLTVIIHLVEEQFVYKSIQDFDYDERKTTRMIWCPSQMEGKGQLNVLYPAFCNTMPYNAIQRLQSTWDGVLAQARAGPYEKARQPDQRNARLQRLGQQVPARFSHQFTQELYRLIRQEELRDFEDMVIFFVAKDLKDWDRSHTYGQLQHTWGER